MFGERGGLTSESLQDHLSSLEPRADCRMQSGYPGWPAGQPRRTRCAL